MAVKTDLSNFVAEEVNQHEGIYVPVKASFTERAMVKKVNIEKLHPNPDDEFCVPDIGPNYSIVHRYEKLLRAGRADEVWKEPLMVQKIRPSGYLIMNGHHRWAAAMRCGIKMIPVKIVNLTQETDIKKMLRASEHDKRVTVDLDEVVFCKDESTPAEKPLGFPANKVYKERIRLGIPALLHAMSVRGYDIWVYSSNFYSYDYISAYFEKYSVKLDGVITGTGRKTKGHAEVTRRTEKLFNAKYKETLHIDEKMVVRSFRDSKNFEEYEITGNANAWSRAVLRIIKGLKKHE